MGTLINDIKTTGKVNVKVFEKMTFQQFVTKRKAHNNEYIKLNPWASGMETENTNKLSYKMYLKGNVPKWAK